MFWRRTISATTPESAEPWTPTTWLLAEATERTSGCTTILGRYSGGVPNNLGVNVGATRAMINNGGFVVVFVANGSIRLVAEWVHVTLAARGIAASRGTGALALTEGGSETYRVKLKVQSENPVTVRVSSSDGGGG